MTSALTGSSTLPPDEAQPERRRARGPGAVFVALAPSLILVLLTVLVIVGVALLQPAFGESAGKLGRPVKIVFASQRSGDWEIYSMTPDGENVVNLTNSPANEGFPLANAAQLAFASDRSGAGLALLVMNLDGSGLVEIQTPLNSANRPTSWSPDGRYLIFESIQDAGPEQFLLDLNIQELISFNQMYGANFEGWSANGSQLILSAPTGAGVEIAISDLSGAIRQPLTNGSYLAGLPDWSPDGRQVAFAAVPPGSEVIDIYVVAAAGGEPANLTQSDSQDLFPRWSPDGSKIAFISTRDGNPEIYVMESDGRNQTNLTNSPAQESPAGDFAWSPDGSQILFHTDRDGDVEIYIMDATGENQLNLSNSPGADDLSAMWVR